MTPEQFMSELTDRVFQSVCDNWKRPCDTEVISSVVANALAAMDHPSSVGAET